MITVQVPLRISFFGGGTDYPSWYREHGGRVLTTTIDKYVYVSLRELPRFFDHRVRVAYSEVEHTQSVADLKHPVFREALRYAGISRDIEAHYDSDLPARSGIGSSSAFTVGLLHAIASMRNSFLSPMQLARDAIHVEQNMIGDVVGCQDQVAVAYGGLNLIDFGRNGSISVTPAEIDDRCREDLERSMMLIYTGLSRHASEVARTYAVNIDEAQKRTLQAIRSTVDAGYKHLKGGDIDAFGRLLDEAWSWKQRLSESISNERINDVYTTARRAGALGGKLLGAGGGGFLLLIVRPDCQADVREALREMTEIPVRFERKGSKTIPYGSNGTPKRY